MTSINLGSIVKYFKFLYFYFTKASELNKTQLVNFLWPEGTWELSLLPCLLLRGKIIFKKKERE